VDSTNTPDYLVNDRNRLSSTFGPRQKASAGFRFDWHRGIDLPADCSTPLHAIAAGTVRLAGVNSSYEDRMVQIRHARPGGGYYYSNYLHLTSVTVAVSDTVTAGQIIAYSGETGIEDVNPTCDPDPAGGFDHLHFEIRNGGVWQEDAVHPLTRLAYPDLTAPQVMITNVNTADTANPTVDVRVELPPAELDLNRVEVVLFDNSGASPVEISRRSFDMQKWTALYTPHPTGTSDLTILDTAPAYDGVYDGDYGDGPVSPAPLGVTPAASGTATDNAGNSASASFGPIKIDKSAPDTTITAHPTDPSPGADASFAFTGSDARSGVARFECRLDNAAFAACTNPQNYTGLANGSHTFQVRAVDHADNVDATPASVTWSVQAQAVSVAISIKVRDTSGAGRAGYLVRVYLPGGRELGNAWSNSAGLTTFTLTTGSHYEYLVEKNGARSAKIGFEATADQTLSYTLAKVTINVGRPGYLVRVYNGTNGGGSEWGNAWSDATGATAFYLVEGDYGYLIEKNAAKSAKAGFTVARSADQTLSYTLARITINVGRPGYLVRVYNGTNGSGSEWGNAWSDATGATAFYLVEGDYGYLVEKNAARSAKAGFTVARSTDQTLSYTLAQITIHVQNGSAAPLAGYLIRIFNFGGGEWGNAWSNSAGDALFYLVEGMYQVQVDKNAYNSGKQPAEGFVVDRGGVATRTHIVP
jgi:hypothetical protein